MKKLRVGVLGLRRGKTFVDNLLALDTVDFVGAADRLAMYRDPQREKIEAVGGKLVAEYDELLEMDLDAVAIASNGRVHAAHSMQALRAGCHVLCEIPVAFHEEELYELRDLIDETGLTYMSAENLCYCDFMRYWRKWLVEGKFGDMALAHCEYVHHLPASLQLPDGRRISPTDAAKEGCLDEAKPIWRADQPPIQYLTHDLGPLLEIFDDRAVSVTCMQAPALSKDAPLRSDGQIALFKTEKGRVIQCTVTLNTRVPGSHQFRIFGTEGGAEWATWNDQMRVLLNSDEDPEKWTWTKLGLAAEGDDVSTGHGGVDLKVVKSFVGAILEGKESPIDIHRGIDYTLPGILANRSAEQGGMPIEIPDSRKTPFSGTTFWNHFPLPEDSDIEKLKVEPVKLKKVGDE
jgi:predicted dehydrogenase